MEMSRDNDQKGKNLLIWKYQVTLARTKAVTYSSQVTVHFSFSNINSLLSATSILFRSPMAYNTTVFFGQTGLHRLCGLWQESRQIWMFFLVQK